MRSTSLFVALAAAFTLAFAATSSAAVSVVASSTGGTAATTSMTLSPPAGTASGDVLVAEFDPDNAPTITAPAGWTKIAGPIVAGGGASLVSYYRVAGSSEPASYTFTLSSAQKWNGGITAYRGVNTTTPLDVATAATAVNNSGAATSLTVPSITTVTAGAMVIGGAGADSGTINFGPPSGFTEAFDVTGQQVAEHAYMLKATTGATGTKTWTATAGRSLSAWMSALRPAVAPPPDTTPPDTTITSAPSGTVTTGDASVSFTGTDNVGVTGFECRIDGAAYAACTSPKTYTGLGNGSHTVDVRAKDAAGNIDASPATATWTVAVPPPPQCSDGVDNSDPEDTLVDYPADPGCTSAADDDETDPPAGDPTPVSGVPVGPLQFRDEFSGTTLDLAKWRPNWFGSTDTTVTQPVNSGTKSCYDPAQATVADGNLNLTAVQRNCLASNGVTYAYATGHVDSRLDYRLTYGYLEARIWLDPNVNSAFGGVGSCAPNWANFWTNGDSWPSTGEIDIMECLGDDVSWHYHATNLDLGGQAPAWTHAMPTTADGYHTFAANWRAGRIDYYYDGALVATVTQGVVAASHYMVLGLEISGTDIRVPQTMKVDYVRVWS